MDGGEQVDRWTKIRPWRPDLDTVKTSNTDSDTDSNNLEKRVFRNFEGSEFEKNYARHIEYGPYYVVHTRWAKQICKPLWDSYRLCLIWLIIILIVNFHFFIFCNFFIFIIAIFFIFDIFSLNISKCKPFWWLEHS